MGPDLELPRGNQNMEALIIIIIGKTAFFQPYPSLEDSANGIRFYFFGFRNNILSRVRGCVTNNNGFWTGFIGTMFYKLSYSQ
jgi:hypothetical protein